MSLVVVIFVVIDVTVVDHALFLLLVGQRRHSVRQYESYCVVGNGYNFTFTFVLCTKSLAVSHHAVVKYVLTISSLVFNGRDVCVVVK